MIDLHIHTSLCRHADGEPLSYLMAAEERGLEIIAFTDHLPLLDRDDTDYAMSRDELPVYVESVLDVAEEALSTEVLLGIEADWIPGREADTAALLDAHPFDVVLGSVHFLGDWAFDDPRHSYRYDDWDLTVLWERYFDDLVRAARSGLFDVMAHPDLIKKFGHRPDRDLDDLYEAAALALAEVGVAVEVSTAGLRKPAREIYPAEPFLAACRRAGVSATIGSDAHTPEEVGYAFNRAVSLMASVGYESMVVFRDRQRAEVTL